MEEDQHQPGLTSGDRSGQWDCEGISVTPIIARAFEKVVYNFKTHPAKGELDITLNSVIYCQLVVELCTGQNAKGDIKKRCL